MGERPRGLSVSALVPGRAEWVGSRGQGLGMKGVWHELITEGWVKGLPGEVLSRFDTQERRLN